MILCRNNDTGVRDCFLENQEKTHISAFISGTVNFFGKCLKQKICLMKFYIESVPCKSFVGVNLRDALVNPSPPPFVRKCIQHQKTRFFANFSGLNYFMAQCRRGKIVSH